MHSICRNEIKTKAVLICVLCLNLGNYFKTLRHFLSTPILNVSSYKLDVCIIVVYISNYIYNIIIEGGGLWVCLNVLISVFAILIAYLEFSEFVTNEIKGNTTKGRK